MALLVQTVHSGTIAVSEADILTFPRGIIGFETSTRFVMRPWEGCRGLYVLQALAGQPAFALLDGRMLEQPFDVQVELEDLIDLDVRKGDKISTYVVLCWTPGNRSLTANMLAPVAVNERARLGKQIVQWYSSYGVRQSLDSGIAKCLRQWCGKTES